MAALEAGLSPSEIFPAPSTLQVALESGEIWDVTNAEGAGYGSMTLRAATVHSVNTVYAQLIDRLGAGTVVEVAKRMGLRCCPRVSNPRHPLKPYLSAVLGTNEVNTLEMASAYGTLATGGVRTRPVPVSQITDAHGTVIWSANTTGDRVLDPQVASVTNEILNEAVLYGTGTAANIGRPQIGKTGTAMDHSDAWFVGAIPQMVAAVWIGFPEGQIPMEPPTTRITVYGGTWPAQIWRLLMLEASRGLPSMAFPNPEVGFVSVSVDASQQPNCLPNPFTLPQNIQTLQFIEGTEPTKVCTSPSSLQEVRRPGDDRVRGDHRDRVADPGRFLRRCGHGALDAAEGHRARADAGGRHAGLPDQHGHDHGVLDRTRGVRRFPVGGPGRPRDTNGLPSTQKRQRRVVSCTPTRFPVATAPGRGPSSTQRSCPATRSIPSSRRSTPRACVSRPGPEHSSRGRPGPAGRPSRPRPRAAPRRGGGRRPPRRPDRRRRSCSDASRR